MRDLSHFLFGAFSFFFFLVSFPVNVLIGLSIATHTNPLERIYFLFLYHGPHGSKAGRCCGGGELTATTAAAAAGLLYT